MQKEKRWLSPKELHEEYGISKSIQAKMRMSRSIPFTKLNKKFVRYDRFAIDRWLESHAVETA